MPESVDSTRESEENNEETPQDPPLTPEQEHRNDLPTILTKVKSLLPDKKTPARLEEEKELQIAGNSDNKDSKKPKEIQVILAHSSTPNEDDEPRESRGGSKHWDELEWNEPSTHRRRCWFHMKNCKKIFTRVSKYDAPPELTVMLRAHAQRQDEPKRRESAEPQQVTAPPRQRRNCGIL